MHSFLGQLHQPLFKHWAFVGPIGLMLLLLWLPQPLQERSSEANPIVSVQLAANKHGPWAPTDLKALLLPNNQGWLKVVFSIPTKATLDNAPPLGVFLSGTFAATAYWNGQKIGHKGQPGGLGSEIPGPIDTVIFLPKALVVAGNNTLTLDMSSQFRMDNVTTLIHGTDALFGLRVSPYSADARRSLNYYLTPLLCSLLLIIGISYLTWKNRSHQRALLIGAFTALLLAGCAEIFRSFYAYPYPFHPWRIVSVQFLVALFFLLLVADSVQQQYGVATQKMWLASAPLSVIGFYLGSNISFYFSLMAGLALFLSIYHLGRRQFLPPNNVLEWIGLSLLLLFSFSDQGLFFDRYLYAAVIPLLAATMWPIAPIHNKNDKEKQTTTRLRVKSAGKERLLDYSSIVVIGGAGNYTEITLLDGTSVLDDRPMKAFEELLPDGFYRVHRSYILNLTLIDAIHSESGGKHQATMRNQKRYPISRQNIQTLRALLQAHSTE